MAEDPVPHAAPGGPGEPVASVLPEALADLVSRARPLPAAELSIHPLGTRLNLRLRDEAAIGRAGEAFGLALPRTACTFEADAASIAVWLGPDEWFLGAGEADGRALVGRLADAIGEAPHSLVDVTERSLTLAIAGPHAADIVNSGCPLDLSQASFPVGSGTRTVLGKSEIMLCRAGEEEFHIDVWRSYAPYVFGYLDEARRDLRS